MRESSDREKETAQVNQKSADFHPRNLVCNLVTSHQGYVCPAYNFHIMHNLFCSHSNMSLFTVEHTYCTRSLVHCAMIYHPMLCAWGWDGQWDSYVEGPESQISNTLLLSKHCENYGVSKWFLSWKHIWKLSIEYPVKFLHGKRWIAVHISLLFWNTVF